MNMSESIIKTIEKVFDISEENISSLTVMLTDIEAGKLYDKFLKKGRMQQYLNTDLLSKVDLLNALLEVILENPQMDSIPSDKKKELTVELCVTVASLYEPVLTQIGDEDIWRGMPYLVMYSMLSYMADRQTMSDLVIKEYNGRLAKKTDLYHTFTLIERLEYDTYYLIVYLMSNIKNQEGLLQLNAFIDRANINLDKVQKAFW